MTDVPGGVRTKEVAKIGKNGTGCINEIGKTRTRWSYKAPDHADEHDSTDDIARPNMHRQKIFSREIGYGKSKHDRPVSDPYEGIPDRDIFGHAVPRAYT